MAKKIFKLDDVDIGIIKILQNEGRISNIELSEKVGISPSPCLRRLKSLNTHGIIKGYYADVDEKLFGYTSTIFASISIEIANEAERDKFEEELANISVIREIYALSVETDYLIKMVVKDWYHYKHVVNTKIAKVPFIKKIRTTTIFRTVKKEHGFDITEDYKS